MQFHHRIGQDIGNARDRRSNGPEKHVLRGSSRDDESADADIIPGLNPHPSREVDRLRRGRRSRRGWRGGCGSGTWRRHWCGRGSWCRRRSNCGGSCRACARCGCGRGDRCGRRSNCRRGRGRSALVGDVDGVRATGELDAKRHFTMIVEAYPAHIRNGRLWTAHNIRVDAAGVASSGAESREAARWYELNGIRSTDNGGVPIVVQSGTVFDSAPTLVTARAFSVPSIMVSGQGHAALGFTTAGAPFRIDAATNGRLAGDVLGTTQAVALCTASSTAYNPPGDSGGPGGRRWGDYSYTSLDPADDMTMWTIQEYCNGPNTYGCRVSQLLAPPPATPALADASVATGQPSVSVVITGTSTEGSGFYDPGAGFTNRIAATVTGGVVVNSVTFTDPTHVTLELEYHRRFAWHQRRHDHKSRLTSAHRRGNLDGDGNGLTYSNGHSYADSYPDTYPNSYAHTDTDSNASGAGRQPLDSPGSSDR